MKIHIHTNFNKHNLHNALQLQRELQEACAKHGYELVRDQASADIKIFLSVGKEDRKKVEAALADEHSIVAFHGWYCHEYSWFCPHGQVDPRIICFQGLAELRQRIEALLPAQAA